MDGSEEGGGAPGGALARRGPRPGARHAGRRYGAAVEDEILRRVAAGETLHGVCADAAMPHYGIVCGWVKGREGFGARLEAARLEAGRPYAAPRTPFCEATFEAILERLCAGEGMVRICRDPALPNVRTVYRWLRARADLREQVALAREIQGDRIAELGFDEAMAVTPATARAGEARLRHLRWYAAVLSPVKHHRPRAVEAWQAVGLDAPEPEPGPEPQVERRWLARSFWLETREDGWWRVRASHPDPDTGRAVEEPPGAWQSPPEGWQPQPSGRFRAPPEDGA